jgi:heat shock protein HslJ
MKSILKFSLPVLAIFLFINCSSTKTSAIKSDAIKTDVSDSSLTETYWKLVELMGKPVATTPAGKKEVYIKFRKEGTRVEGFGGCNGFGGKFETKNNFNISITDVISTMMACPDLENENELFNVIKTVDNYYIKDDTLSLGRAKMATMARFIAVDLK